MITFFTGTPGSGKTYEAVDKIVQNLADGRTVYTNIDGMEDDRCHEAIKTLAGLNDLQFSQRFHHLGSYVNKEPEKVPVPEGAINLAWFWKYCDPGSLIVLDEAQKIFGCRDTKMKHNADFADWASTHRHYGYDLVIITQVAERVEVGVRSLTEWNYVFRKVNFFGGAVQRRYLCNSYAGESTAGQPLKKSVRAYNGKVFLCYKSYISKDIKEQGFMTHVNILHHPIFYAIPVVLGLCLYMVFFKSSFATGDIFGADKAMKESLALIPSAHAKTSPSSKTPPELKPIKQELVNVTPGAKPASQAPSPTPAPAAADEPTPTNRVKLNYIQVFHKDNSSEIKISFNHCVYTEKTFPYPISRQHGLLYATIPVSDYTPPERVTSIEPPAAVAQSESESSSVASIDR